MTITQYKIAPRVSFRKSRILLTAAHTHTLPLLLLAVACLNVNAQQQSPRPVGTPTPTASPRPNNNAPSQTPDVNSRASESAIDASLPDDPQTAQTIAPYKAKVEQLSEPIGQLTDRLTKRGVGGGGIGNFVADAIRKQAEAQLNRPVRLAVINTGGLRKNEVAAGDIRVIDIYELLPFENAVVAVDLTGEQLLRFMSVIVARRDAQSGARILYRYDREKKQNEIVEIALRNADNTEEKIDPKATYTVVTIDYLVKRGGDYKVLQEATNVRPLNLTMRDAVLAYVRAETAAKRKIKATLDGRFRYQRDTTNTTDKPDDDNN